MDFDLIVIGSGPGGYIAAIRAAQLGLKVACIERYDRLGGTCLNVGCIPSKSLLQSSELLWSIQQESGAHGIEATATLNFSQMMQRKSEVVASFNSGIAALFKKNRITPIHGHATFQDPHTIQVEQKTYSARHFIIATGSKPATLPFLPLDEKTILSSTGALTLTTPPKTLIVIGAGVIGLELGSVYARLGSQVTFIEFFDRVCPPLDKALSKPLQKILEKQKMAFHLSHKVIAAQGTQLQTQTPDGKSHTFESDAILVAIGRRPYTQNLGLENLGITPEKNGTLAVNDTFQTQHRHIYAIGDLIDGPMLAHKASEEGIAVAEIIAGQQPTLHYIAIPSIIYTFPEVATVGLTEEAAQAKNIPYITAQFPLRANSRARCMAQDEGFVKLIAHKKSAHLLGCHIIAPHAGDLIHEVALALTQSLTYHDLIHTCHAHPTLAEALFEAALSLEKRTLHL